MTNVLSVTSQLRSYQTGAISDALDELGIPCVLPGLAAQRIGQERVAGRALPVHFTAAKDDEAALRYGGGVGRPLEQVLKVMEPGDVIVMDLGGMNNASAWGGLASRLSQRRGVNGTILWGTCRDVEEIRAIGYPVWSIGVCPRRSRNEFTFGTVKEPITISGVTINYGDTIVADESGVLCVPAESVNSVLEQLRKIEHQERILEQQVRESTVVNWDDL
jgi:4-hydroxy-4-methyl-2-oxoglutarate aldolase